MKRTLICNIKLFGNAEKTVYESTNRFLPATDTAVMYPSTAAYEKILGPGDELDVIMIAKESSSGDTEKNIVFYEEELRALSSKTGAKINIDVISSSFDESTETHNELLLQIVDYLEENAEITLDMTFGPKDLVIVEFAALNFAECYLGCEIGEIMYGQADFAGGRPVNTRICEMGDLYYINSIISRVQCDDPKKARKMLEILLRM